MSDSDVAGLILSGGASRRMGTPKALLRIGGETFLDRLIRVFATNCDPVTVVLGHDSERVRGGLEAPGRAIFTINPDPERGMFSSLQYGLRALPESAQAVIFTPVDYPNIQSATIARIAAAFRESDCDVVIPVNLGLKGHPVCVSRYVIDAMLALPPSAQARDVIRQHREQTLFVEVEDPGITIDVDTPADFENLTQPAPCFR